MGSDPLMRREAGSSVTDVAAFEQIMMDYNYLGKSHDKPYQTAMQWVASLDQQVEDWILAAKKQISAGSRAAVGTFEGYWEAMLEDDAVHDSYLYGDDQYKLAAVKRQMDRFKVLDTELNKALMNCGIAECERRHENRMLAKRDFALFFFCRENYFGPYPPSPVDLS